MKFRGLEEIFDKKFRRKKFFALISIKLGSAYVAEDSEKTKKKFREKNVGLFLVIDTQIVFFVQKNVQYPKTYEKRSFEFYDVYFMSYGRFCIQNS